MWYKVIVWRHGDKTCMIVKKNRKYHITITNKNQTCERRYIQHISTIGMGNNESEKDWCSFELFTLKK